MTLQKYIFLINIANSLKFFINSLIYTLFLLKIKYCIIQFDSE
jgi:hypothetical protein